MGKESSPWLHAPSSYTTPPFLLPHPLSPTVHHELVHSAGTSGRWFEPLSFFQHTEALLWSELVEGLFPKAPNLKQKNSKAPYITGGGELPVFNCLNSQYHRAIFKISNYAIYSSTTCGIHSALSAADRQLGQQLTVHCEPGSHTVPHLNGGPPNRYSATS